MVYVEPLIAAVTPLGKPVTVAPVAVPPIVKLIFTGEFTHTTGELFPELNEIDGDWAVIVPLAEVGLQVPVVVIVYVKLPVAVGEPLMVNWLPTKLLVTPAGKPVTKGPLEVPLPTL